MGPNGSEKSKPRKKYIYSFKSTFIPSFNNLAQFGGEIEEENPFFKVEKGKTSHIPPPNRPRRLIFGYDTQLCTAYRWAQKGTIFQF